MWDRRQRENQGQTLGIEAGVNCCLQQSVVAMFSQQWKNVVPDAGQLPGVGIAASERHDMRYYARIVLASQPRRSNMGHASTCDIAPR